jgi:hypothetical protein
MEGISLGPILGPAIRQLAGHDLGTPSRLWLRDVGRIGQQFDAVVEPDAGGDRVDRA